MLDLFKPFSLQVSKMEKLRIAVIGQSAFGADVYKLLKAKHEIVGVFSVPDESGKADALGKALCFKV